MQFVEGEFGVAVLPSEEVGQEPQRLKYIELRCPACGAGLMALPYHSLSQVHKPVSCSRCRGPFEQRDGIWLALPDARRAYFARFQAEYETVRKAEGRGSEKKEFYLALPYRDLSNRNSWQWSIRARTYRYIEKELLPALHREPTRSLTVLDLGAGNGWLSYRLAALGHRPIAVDLQTNAYDGLGAAIHYRGELPALFPRFQAELDRLPFADAQFDCAIFNASFHYSENYDRTVAEAVRCLRPGGTIVIADSPTYSCEEAGIEMIEERRRLFQERFGFVPDSLASREYLTRDRLLALEVRHDLEWKTHRVWYGIRWVMRPFAAKWNRRREPSQFWLYTAEVKSR